MTTKLKLLPMKEIESGWLQGINVHAYCEVKDEAFNAWQHAWLVVAEDMIDLVIMRLMLHPTVVKDRIAEHMERYLVVTDDPKPVIGDTLATVAIHHTNVGLLELQLRNIKFLDRR